MFCPANESFVTGSTITSVLPDVVSPICTAGESSAKSMNSRPFTGKSTIWFCVMTVLTCVRVGSCSSEVASTSTFSATLPGVRLKSRSADCPTCSVMVFVCLPKPAKTADTEYSPAGSAGIVYSPPSDACTVRENPVALCVAATVAFAMLPPDASTTFPESVAFTACPQEFETWKNARHSTAHATTNCKHTKFFLLTPHPRQPKSKEGLGAAYSRPQIMSRLCRLKNLSFKNLPILTTIAEAGTRVTERWLRTLGSGDCSLRNWHGNT